MKAQQKQLPDDYYGTPPGFGRKAGANANDVASPLSIVVAMYECISGSAGQPRDWDRLRSLALPETRFIRTGKLQDGAIGCKVMKIEEYIRQMEPWLVENGFFENEVHRAEERYGNITQVFSTYESRRSLNDPEPFMRGINSFQLLYDGNRWWIVNVMWQHESPEYPIPPEYLNR